MDYWSFFSVAAVLNAEWMMMTSFSKSLHAWEYAANTKEKRKREARDAKEKQWKQVREQRKMTTSTQQLEKVTCHIKAVKQQLITCGLHTVNVVSCESQRNYTCIYKLSRGCVCVLEISCQLLCITLYVELIFFIITLFVCCCVLKTRL